MAEYLIQDTTLTGIADAIRGKTGGTDPVAVSDMAAQIEGIEAGGGGDTLTMAFDKTIEEYSNGSITTIPGKLFRTCKQLKKLHLPSVTSFADYELDSCEKLVDVDFSALKTVGNRSMWRCYELECIILPAVTTIAEYGFAWCTKLSKVTLPSVTSIDTMAFGQCGKLTAVVISQESSVCTLKNSDAFSGGHPNYNPISGGTGYIYVPSALIEQYKVAPNWSTYATQFRALEDYTVDGTVTGELDEAKI